MDQNQEKEEQKEENDTGLWNFGMLITWLYLIAVVIISLVIICTNNYGIASIKDIQFSSLGDFLAGVFGPVAFFWLILGYRLQQTELKQNTEALHLQAIELKNTVAQYERMVKLTEAQFEENKKILQISSTPLISLQEGTLYSLTAGGHKDQWSFLIHNAGGTAKKINITIYKENDIEFDEYYEEVDQIYIEYLGQTQSYSTKFGIENFGMDLKYDNNAPLLKMSISAKDIYDRNITNSYTLVLQENLNYQTISGA